MSRRVAVGLSLATLWYIGIWSDLLPFLYISDRFPIGALPCWNDFVAVVLNVACLGAVFAALGRVHDALPPRWAAAAEWIFLASFAVPANVVRNHFHLPFGPALSTPPRAAMLAGAVLVAAAALAAIVRWRSALVGAAVWALAVMFPLVPITVAQAGWAVAQAGGRMQCSAGASLAAPLAGTPRVRVVWVMFDELEQHAAFEARPAWLRLPELDRLRGEALVATAAGPPGDRTERSMPGVLSGREVGQSVLVGRNQLRVTFRGSAAPAAWDGSHTVFADARGLGLNTGVAGFFLPYCALLGDVLTSCTWQACVTCGRMVGAFGDSVPASMANQLSELAPGYSRRRHLSAYRALQDAALRLAADRSLGLVLLHLPVPHAPPIYDAAAGAFSFGRPEGAGYYDNLALADRSFGEIRRAMEAAGTWSTSAVVVFGDHGRRDPADENRIVHRGVPFMLRLPGDARAATYAEPFDLAGLRALTMEILEGRVRTNADAVSWLDGNRHRWLVP